ncbi:MAG: metallophosphoesterase [Acetobacteraceae bacterium]|nr:metallophosphoesterase [Acetobacteraceae bacterium]
MERSEERAAPARLPQGLRLYAIGDVHGCADRLARLLDLIADDAAAAPEPDRRVVFLGDYVDRGPDSRGTIEHILGPLAFRAQKVALMGNHEAMMLAALERPNEESVSLWLANGALATLGSYGVDAAVPAAAWSRSRGRAASRLLAPPRADTTPRVDTYSRMRGSGRAYRSPRKTRMT